MRDIPVFTSEYGAASLTLREIPRRGEAYIRIQASEAPMELARECGAFCRACGAERCYAAAFPGLEGLEKYTSVLRMTACCLDWPETDAALWPVQEDTAEPWRRIYMEKMAAVPGASAMQKADGLAMAREGSGYFIHRGGQLLGIGRIRDNRVLAVAGCVKGAGRDLMLALRHAAWGDRLELEAAEANLPAMRLYRSLGFLPVEEVECWYRIF